MYQISQEFLVGDISGQRIVPCSTRTHTTIVYRENGLRVILLYIHCGHWIMKGRGEGSIPRHHAPVSESLFSCGFSGPKAHLVLNPLNRNEYKSPPTLVLLISWSLLDMNITDSIDEFNKLADLYKMKINVRSWDTQHRSLFYWSWVLKKFCKFFNLH